MAAKMQGIAVVKFQEFDSDLLLLVSTVLLSIIDHCIFSFLLYYKHIWYRALDELRSPGLKRLFVLKVGFS